MKRFHDMLFYALMAGILVQVLMMPGEPGGRGGAQSPAQLPFRPGDTLRSLSGVDEAGLPAVDPASAHAFAKNFHWNVDIRSMVGVSAREKQHGLVSRTPWVFVFDSEGVLRMEGHGNRVAEADETVSFLLSQQLVTN